MRSRPDKRARNFQIFNDVIIKAMSEGDAAKKYSVTRQRVHQIINTTAERILSSADSRFISYKLCESVHKKVEGMRLYRPEWAGAMYDADKNLIKIGE